MVSLDRARGLLLGVAIGDAHGLPYEGISKRRVRRWTRDWDHPTSTPRYALLGKTGFVSDDTEQSALLLTAVLRARRADPDSIVPLAIHRFRRSLVGWFWRLPWGIGLATLRACLLMTFGLQRSGRRSAGNGAAMRSAVLALAYPEAVDDDARRAFARLSALPTHTDPRAVESAVYCAELAALCLREDNTANRANLVQQALVVVEHPELRDAIALGLRCAHDEALFARQRATGFIVHTLTTAVAAFVRDGDDVLRCLRTIIRQGDDTDTVGAIVGGWLGALHGAGGLPAPLVEHLGPGPFGRAHLEALAHAVVDDQAPVPDFSATVAMLRNLALMPVVLAHGFRRLLPF